MVEDHQVGIRFAALRRDLVDLAAAGEQRGIGTRSSPAQIADNGGTRRLRERLDLACAIGAVPAPDVERDDERAIAAIGTFEHPASSTHAKPHRASAMRGGMLPARRLRQLSASW